jgi:hypothetical protein
MYRLDGTGSYRLAGTRDRLTEQGGRLTSILGRGRRGGVRGGRGVVLPLFWGFGGHRGAWPQGNYLNYSLVHGE